MPKKSLAVTVVVVASLALLWGYDRGPTSQAMERGMRPGMRIRDPGMDAPPPPRQERAYRSPFDLAFSPDDTMLAVSDRTAGCLYVLDARTGDLGKTIQLRGKPSALAWTSTDTVVVCEYGAGSVAQVNARTGEIVRRFFVGPKPIGLAVAPKKGLLVVCDHGLHTVSIVDLSTGSTRPPIPCGSHPFAVAITPDEQMAIVANLLPSGPAVEHTSTALVSLIDLNAATKIVDVPLPDNSANVRGVAVSPDGRWAYVVHTRGRTMLPTTQLDRGWVNTNALSIIDLAAGSEKGRSGDGVDAWMRRSVDADDASTRARSNASTLYATVLLDTVTEGAADPWGIVLSPDGETAWISVAGAHQIAKIELGRLHTLLTPGSEKGRSGLYSSTKSRSSISLKNAGPAAPGWESITPEGGGATRPGFEGERSKPEIFPPQSRPDSPSSVSSRRWAYLGVCEDYLIAGANFTRYSPLLKPPGDKPDAAAPFVDWSASRTLVVMNRYDGKVLWSVDADNGFIHNGIAAGGGMVFCLDAVPPYVKRNAKQDAKVGQTSRLLAMDLRTGRVVWDTRDVAFGTWLGFSEQFGVLVQAHRKSSDMLWEPGDRMAAFRAQTGEVLWDRKTNYSGPCMLRAGTIFTQESAYDLLTGLQRTYPHPLTGETIPWEYSRNHGCNTAIASENLLTFRSAAAGYYDLTNDGGTGNFGGFRSGCTSNLIVANGILNAPDYTSTCTCSYQNQTSLAMVHMPDAEMWTFSKVKSSNAPIQNVGINFGAPGDRRAENGTFWLEHPGVGGNSAELDISLTPEKPSWFRRHSSRLQRGVIPWVEASGAEGLRSVRVRVSGRHREKTERADLDGEHSGADQSYTVHLHFMEPRDKRPGERRFDVALNGQTVLEDVDIVAQAGSPNVGIVRTFQGIRASDFLTVSLTPADANSETVLCGIEIVTERLAVCP